MSETQSWRERAAELHDRGGVPKRRAQAVALREQGLTYRAIADELDVDHHSGMRTQVEAYLDQRDAAQWLLEHGPEESEL